eukprot:c28330_g1_i1 orf=579-2120(-)
MRNQFSLEQGAVIDPTALEEAINPVLTDEEHQGDSEQGSDTPPPLARDPEPLRLWRDVFWLGVFSIHMVGLGFVLAVLGINRLNKVNRLNLDKYAKHINQLSSGDQTEVYWPMYGTAGVIGAVLSWAWLSILCHRANQMMKVAVHIITTYLAVISVFCFWDGEIFWGIVFAVGALLQFLYIISVMDRLPFTMLVLRKAVKMVLDLPEAAKLSYVFVGVMLMWMTIWSFGVSGVVASSMGNGGRWWVLLVLSVSLFWTGAVFCNTVHVIVAGLVALVLIHGGKDTESIPPRPLLRSLRHAITTSLGSICYGSLFTAAIRTLRWAIRGLRSHIDRNECLLCCVDFLFHLVETLVRFFNKYAYVQVAVTGKSFNHSARDAWELFQCTGVEALIAYDCSGAILLMGIVLGGLVTGSCVGVWTWFKREGQVVMVGTTAMLMGMILVGLTLVVVESAVTCLYICYAMDPSLISRWDSEFHSEISEALHQRLQHRSGRANDVAVHHAITLQSQKSLSDNT